MFVSNEAEDKSSVFQFYFGQNVDVRKGRLFCAKSETRFARLAEHSASAQTLFSQEFVKSQNDFHFLLPFPLLYFPFTVKNNCASCKGKKLCKVR